MGGNLPLLGPRSLSQLTLPASHDAGMYLSGFPQSLGQTQSMPIYSQLIAGVRWFDLRPEFDGGQFYIHHGPIRGPRLSDILGDVRRFMAENHHELVLLKWSHFAATDLPAYRSLAQQVHEALAPWLYQSLPAGKRLADIPLADFVRDHGSVLVLCDGRFPLAYRQPGIWCYRDWESSDAPAGDLCVYDQYSNTTSYETMKAEQVNRFLAFDGRCRQQANTCCDLFLLSWTLTPPTNVISIAQRANLRLGDVMEQTPATNSHARRINLLYADDAGEWLTKVALRMNGR
jgi:hypothetical protein